MKFKLHQKLLLAFVSILAFLPMVSIALCEVPVGPGPSGGGP